MHSSQCVRHVVTGTKEISKNAAGHSVFRDVQSKAVKTSRRGHGTATTVTNNKGPAPSLKEAVRKVVGTRRRRTWYASIIKEQVAMGNIRLMGKVHSR